MGLFIEDPNSVIRSSIRELQLTTNLTKFSPGSKAQAMLLAMNNQYKMAMDLFEIGAAQTFVNGATGLFLDFIGEMLGVKRNGEKRATSDEAAKNFKFYTNFNNFGEINDNQPIFIGNGTPIGTEKNSVGETVNFFVVGDYWLPVNVNEYYITIAATAGGKEFNVGPGTLTQFAGITYADQINKTLKCTNLGTINNGDGVEDDDHYRYRIINNRLTGEAANITAIRLAALSVPGVADVVDLEYYRGIGTGDLIIQSNTGYVHSDLIDVVQQRIDLTAKAWGNSIRVRGPIEVGIETYLTINYKRGAKMSDAEAVETQYLANYRQMMIEKAIGEGLIINQMLSAFPLYDAVLSIGKPNQPFDMVYIYKPSSISDTRRVRSKLLNDYVARFDEKIVPEISIKTPLFIRRNI